MVYRTSACTELRRYTTHDGSRYAPSPGPGCRRRSPRHAAPQQLSRRQQGWSASWYPPRCPLLRPGRQLVVTNIPNGRIFRITADAQWQLATEYDGWPKGLAVHRDSSLWITDYRRGLLRLDPASGRIETLLSHRNFESFRSLNVIVRRGPSLLDREMTASIRDTTVRCMSSSSDLTTTGQRSADGSSSTT